MAYALIGGTALVVGFVGSLAGFGGGVLIVPILTFAFGYPIHEAIGSCMLALVPGTLVASIGYYRRGLADLPLALLVFGAGIATTYLGAALATELPGSVLKPIFGGLLMVLGVRMLHSVRRGRGRASEAMRSLNELRPVFRRVIVDGRGQTFPYQVSAAVIVLLGAVAGFIGGLLGVGGGFLTTPVLVLACGVPVRVAVATSLLMITATAAVGAFSHYQHGNVNLPLAGAIAVGLSLGGALGPRVAHASSEGRLRIVVGGMLAAVGVGMLVAAAF
jgi:uncharacterized membrane protein YfcA